MTFLNIYLLSEFFKEDILQVEHINGELDRRNYSDQRRPPLRGGRVPGLRDILWIR